MAKQVEPMAETLSVVHESWDYSYCAAYDIIPLDPPASGSSHKIVAMEVDVASANNPYINGLFRMKRSEYSNEVVFKSGGNQDNAVRELVRTVATGQSADRNAASLQLAHKLAEVTPGQAPRGLLVVIVGKYGNQQRVAIWRFPNQETLSVVKVDKGFQFSVTKTFVGQETQEFKAAAFQGTASKTSMWNGRVKDFQTANRNLDVAKYWLAFLQCELQLRPDYATSLACKALNVTADKAETEEQREEVNAAVLVLRNQDGAMKTMNEIRETLPEERRPDFVKALKLPEDQLDLPFAIKASQVEAAYKYRVISFESGIRLKAKQEAFEDERITVERQVDGGIDRVTIRGRILKDKAQAR